MGIGPSAPNLTMLVNVEVPESALSVYSDAVVRKALASVTLRPAPIQEQLGMLPFKIDDLSLAFKSCRLCRQAPVILAEDPSDSNERQPFMIVSVDRGGPPEDSRPRAVCSQSVVERAGARTLDTIIGGNAGRWSRRVMRSAQMVKVHAGDAVSLVQWIRFSPGGFCASSA